MSVLPPSRLRTRYEDDVKSRLVRAREVLAEADKLVESVLDDERNGHWDDAAARLRKAVDLVEIARINCYTCSNITEDLDPNYKDPWE